MSKPNSKVFPPQSIYFLHIPKTGGTSLNKLLRSYYKPKRWLPVYELPQLLQLSRQKINSYKCFGGHFGTGLFSLLDRPVDSMTMLRDPFEQFISNIHFVRRYCLNEYNPANYSEHDRQTYNELINIFSKDDYIERIIDYPPMSKNFINCQSRQLGCELDLQPLLGKSTPDVTVEKLIWDQADMDAIFYAAKCRLDNMAVVGILESFADSCRLVCNLLQIHVYGTYPEINVSNERQQNVHSSYRQLGVVSSSLANKIDELLQYDHKIYDYGKLIFQSQLEILNSKPPRDSNHLRKLMAKVRALLG